MFVFTATGRVWDLRRKTIPSSYPHPEGQRSTKFDSVTPAKLAPDRTAWRGSMVVSSWKGAD